MRKDDAKQKIAAGLEALSEAVQNGRSEEFEQYLRVMSRFHRYSFGNSILILCQRADATHVASPLGNRFLSAITQNAATGTTGNEFAASCKSPLSSQALRSTTRAGQRQLRVAMRSARMIRRLWQNFAKGLNSSKSDRPT